MVRHIVRFNSAIFSYHTRKGFVLSWCHWAQQKWKSRHLPFHFRYPGLRWPRPEEESWGFWPMPSRWRYAVSVLQRAGFPCLRLLSHTPEMGGWEEEKQCHHRRFMPLPQNDKCVKCFKINILITWVSPSSVLRVCLLLGFLRCLCNLAESWTCWVRLTVGLSKRRERGGGMT